MCKYFSIEDLLDIDCFQSYLCENCPKLDCENIGDEHCLRRAAIADIIQEINRFNASINSILDKNKKS